MMLVLQAAPLLVLLGLLLSGRAGPVPAVAAALVAAVPAALASLPADVPALPFLAEEAARGAFLALKPILVVTGGLLFHAAVTGAARPALAPPAPRRIFVATLLVGAFMESVTGFAVGAVFALSALRGMGIGGAPAGAMALLALTLVPWGGLGPGTALGAALVGLPPQTLAEATAWPNAVWYLLMGPVLWRLCAAAKLQVPRRERLAQMALLAMVAGGLVLSHRLFPFEVAGLLATAGPTLWALWRLDPPRGAEGWRRAMRGMAPYLGLTAALLLARAWPAAPAWTPFADLPGFPATHVGIVLWAVSAVLLAGRARLAGPALRRAGRPAAAMLLYVVLARWLAGSGIAGALAGAAAQALGPAAPFAVPVIGLVSGMVTGTNVGSNAALMPVQAGLGQAAGMEGWLAPSLHNFAGAAGAGMSFAVTAMICALLADGTRPATLWRLLLPSILAVPAIGWVVILVSR
jgi:lactate permease